jgi:UDP-N-acetylmuramate: L-alanyl-gamma-D-glutamyl-meso-diaminopimelate ligase
LLDRTGFDPGFLVGGLPRNFPRSFRAPGKARLPVAGRPARRTPFVIEGDEYDTAFFEKTPKFWHYRPEVAVLTSIEHDHIDIYPTLAGYLAAFRKFVSLVPEHGLIIANGADPLVREVVAGARAEVAYFALQGEDTGGAAPHWLAAPVTADASGQSFDLFAGGVFCGRLALAVPGRHNLKNALAALGAVAQGYGARLADLGPALASFQGVRRRQELVDVPRGISVYDDFAHHPTAVRETLAALRSRHEAGRMIAVFEPRSATACRKLHQADYPEAFAAADVVLLAPLGRTNLPKEETLDLDVLVEQLKSRGKQAERVPDLDAIVERVGELARSGDVVALLSNGAFGGMTRRVVARLAGTAAT